MGLIPSISALTMWRRANGGGKEECRHLRGNGGFSRNGPSRGKASAFLMGKFRERIRQGVYSPVIAAWSEWCHAVRVVLRGASGVVWYGWRRVG